MNEQTIQEEIRQGLEDRICHYDAFRTSYSYADFADEILKFLDSKRVRIVDSWWDLNKQEKVFETERLE